MNWCQIEETSNEEDGKMMSKKEIGGEKKIDCLTTQWTDNDFSLWLKCKLLLVLLLLLLLLMMQFFNRPHSLIDEIHSKTITKLKNAR